MKRLDLLQHLRQPGCRFVREGGDHSIWEHLPTNRRTAVPRHRDIPDYTAKRICLGFSRLMGGGLPSNASGRFLSWRALPAMLKGNSI